MQNKLTKQFKKLLNLLKRLSVIRDYPFLIRVNPFKFIVSIAILSLFLFPKLTHASNINFTLETWINPTTSIATKAILVKNNEMRLVTDASGYLLCQIHNGVDWQTAGSSSTTALELNKWSQAGCSYDGANIRVYINGALKGTQAMTTDAQNTANKFFAGYDAGGTYGRFSGKIDEVAIYNDVLTQQEFADHYSRGNLYKDENNNLKFEIGGLNLSYDISSWVSGGWHMITALWDPAGGGIGPISQTSPIYGALFVDGSAVASSSTAFLTASSTPSTFYFAQDSFNSGQFGGTVYGLQIDEENWQADEITAAYNSGSGASPAVSDESNFLLSTASSTDVIGWSHSGNLAADGNMEDGDAAEWTGSASGYVSAEGGSVRNENSLAGGWNFEDDLTDATGNNTLTGTNIAAADYVEGKFGKAIDFDGSTEYLSQTNYYTQADDDGEVSGVLTDGSATVVINDASNLSTTYDASGGINNYMIVLTDSVSQVAWGYLGTNSFSTPNNTYEIYNTRTGTTQNYAAKGTFSFANIPITYQIRKTNFQLSSAFTIAAWINKSALGIEKHILHKNDTVGIQYIMLVDTNNKVRGYVGSGTATASTFSSAILANTWYFVGLVWDGTNNKLYINGVWVDNADTPAVPTDSYYPLRIGINRAGTAFWGGSIDSPSIYSRALSADEIRAKYEQGYGDKYGAKIRLAADDAASYLDESLTTGSDYLLSFDYRMGESNINPINFTATGTAAYIPETNVMSTSLTGLVGAWNFEEGTGSSVADLSGNGNNGTITNATWSTSGKFGKALSFDGDGDYVNAGNNNSSQFSGGVSFEAWVKSAVTGGTFIRRDGDSIDEGWYIFRISSNKAELQLLDHNLGNISSVNSSNNITDDSWHYIVGTTDRNNLNIYVDGVNRGTVVDNTNDTLGSSAEPCWIGAWGAGETLTGLIDSVRIYNRALTADEIYQQYKEGLKYTYSTSFESDLTGANLFKFIQNGATSGDSIIYVDNVNLMANLVNKGGMEGTFTDGIPAGWLATTDPFEPGEGAEETTERHTGSKSFELVDADDGEGIKQTITVASGSWYTLEIWSKNNNQDVEAVISGGATDTIDLTTANYNWNRSYRTYKSNAPNITIQIQAGAANQDGFFDDVSVVALGSNSATVAASTAAFTPAFGYRPGKVSGENALSITLSDDLRFDEGAQMGTSTTELAYETFDPYQGTIKTWVRPYWDGTDTGTHVILEDNNGTDYFKLYYSNGNLYWDIYRSSTTYRTYQSVSAWTAGTWYHIAAAWSNQNAVNADATGYISNLYINGSDSGNTYSNLTAGTNFWTAFAPSTIQIGADSSQANQWNGLLSGLSILNSPLSESEISADYNGGSGVLTAVNSDTIFYLPANSADADGMARWHLKNYREVTANENGLAGGWNFENSASDVGGVYTGTWTGSANYVAGKNGNAADFDGSTDYVDFGDIAF